MTEADPTATPSEHHRHSAPPQQTNTWKVVAIILAALVAVALIVFLIWFFGFRNAGPVPTPTPTPTPTASPTPTPTETVSPPPLAACNTDTATAELGSADPAAGTTTVPIVFTNTSSGDCTLEGFPTVEFVGDGNGTQIGATATQNTGPSPVQVITLAPGQSAAAMLSITTAGNVCDAPVAVDGFRVIPPGSQDAYFLATTDYQACPDPNTELLTVTAIDNN